MKKAVLATGITAVCAGSAVLAILWLYWNMENEPRHVRHTEVLLSSIDAAIAAFVEDTGTLPESLEEMVNPGPIAGWNGPYLRHDSLVDAWNNQLLYGRIGAQDAYLLLSTGKNGKLYGRGEESVLFSPKSGSASNKGFNRTPVNSAAAKPVELSGGAG